MVQRWFENTIPKPPMNKAASSTKSNTEVARFFDWWNGCRFYDDAGEVIEHYKPEPLRGTFLCHISSWTTLNFVFSCHSSVWSLPWHPEIPTHRSFTAFQRSGFRTNFQSETTAVSLICKVVVTIEVTTWTASVSRKSRIPPDRYKLFEIKIKTQKQKTKKTKNSKNLRAQKKHKYLDDIFQKHWPEKRYTSWHSNTQEILLAHLSPCIFLQGPSRITW